MVFPHSGTRLLARHEGEALTELHTGICQSVVEVRRKKEIVIYDLSE